MKKALLKILIFILFLSASGCKSSAKSASIDGYWLDTEEREEESAVYKFSRDSSGLIKGFVTRKEGTYEINGRAKGNNIRFDIDGLTKEKKRMLNSNSQINVFLKDSASKQQIDAFKQKIQSFPEVKGVNHISKEAAIKRLRNDFRDSPEVLQVIEANPLPASIEVFPKSAKNILSVVRKLKDPVVIEQVSYSSNIVNIIRDSAKKQTMRGRIEGDSMLLTWRISNRKGEEKIRKIVKKDAESLIDKFEKRPFDSYIDLYNRKVYE